jgi:hypothetical protein
MDIVNLVQECVLLNLLTNRNLSNLKWKKKITSKSLVI